MPPLHYGPTWANSNQCQCVEEGWLVLVDAGNDIGDGWPLERFFRHIKEGQCCEVTRWRFHKAIDIAPTPGPLCGGTVKSTRFTGGQHDQHHWLTLGHSVDFEISI